MLRPTPYSIIMDGIIKETRQNWLKVGYRNMKMVEIKECAHTTWEYGKNLLQTNNLETNIEKTKVMVKVKKIWQCQ